MKIESVHEIRESLGLTQRQLGRILGYQSGQMVSHWESGRKDAGGPALALLQLLVWLRGNSPKTCKKVLKEMGGDDA